MIMLHILSICIFLTIGPFSLAFDCAIDFPSMAENEWGVRGTAKNDVFKKVEQGTNILERLLNKPYVNEVTLRGKIPPLKCF